MSIKEMEIYHTPTERNIICLCLNTNQFELDCKKYIIDRYSTFSVNPEKRFYARIDKLIDNIINDEKRVPFRFRMRLESRHCIEKIPVYYAFQFFDKESIKKSSLFKDLSEEEQACLNPVIDYIIIYTGMQGIS